MNNPRDVTSAQSAAHSDDGLVLAASVPTYGITKPWGPVWEALWGRSGLIETVTAGLGAAAPAAGAVEATAGTGAAAWALTTERREAKTTVARAAIMVYVLESVGKESKVYGRTVIKG